MSDYTPYFERFARLPWPPVPPPGPHETACVECPAACMDRDVWVALREEPKELREAVHGKGHCHMEAHRQCRGGRIMTDQR